MSVEKMKQEARRKFRKYHKGESLHMAKEARKEIKKEHPDFFRKYGDLTNFFAFDDVSGKKIKLKKGS